MKPRPAKARPALEGRYSNYFKVGHNDSEVLIDFGQVFHDGEDVDFHTRIVTNPMYAKALCQLLLSTIDGYEQSYGPIDD
jgi:hypothetical protein